MLFRSVVDPAAPDATLYVATDIGVFRSTNGGATWSVLGTGLPAVAVLSLKLHTGSRTLVAATHGRGMWDLSVPPVTGPLINSLAPTGASAGGPDFTLTVNGSDFDNGAVVRWNGADRTTTFVNGGQLTATIAAADIATPGTATVTVANPGGATSAGVSFAISDFTLGVSPTSMTVSAGQSAAYTVTVTASGGSFDNAVALTRSEERRVGKECRL